MNADNICIWMSGISMVLNLAAVWMLAWLFADLRRIERRYEKLL